MFCKSLAYSVSILNIPYEFHPLHLFFSSFISEYCQTIQQTHITIVLTLQQNYITLSWAKEDPVCLLECWPWHPSLCHFYLCCYQVPESNCWVWGKMIQVPSFKKIFHWQLTPLVWPDSISISNLAVVSLTLYFKDIPCIKIPTVTVPILFAPSSHLTYPHN